MNNPLLICQQLSKSYQDGMRTTEVLKQVSFSLQRSELMAIVGSSGSGKSTLLHLLGGLDKPTSGEIIFNGQSLRTFSNAQLAQMRNQNLGFIYQFHHLLPDFTALENVAMPLLIAGLPAKEASDRAMDMLLAVGLEKQHANHPSALSGGERQRVAIGRALINEPDLVMADEPTGNLDHTTANKVFDLLLTLNQQKKTAFLVVTHDRQLATRLGQQMMMTDGHLTSVTL